MSSKCDFAFFLFGLFSLQVFWENSEPIQTAFRASHDKAHGLGSLNFIVLCEEIILLCSLILALASFIQCPLAQGSTEPFLIYPFHSSHYFINHSKSFFETEVKLFFSNQTVISKAPLPAERHRHGITLNSDTWTWRKTECVTSHLFPKRVQLVTYMVTALWTEDWTLCQERELSSDF